MAQWLLGSAQARAVKPPGPLGPQAFEARHPDCQVILHEHLITGDDWDMWCPLRAGESEALVYWNGMNEPDLTAGPVLGWLDRVLLVARGHRLAGRASVSTEELAGERLMQRPPSLPQDLFEALIPPVTPSGRPIACTEPVRSLHELVSLVARGRMVHPTGAGILPARRTDIAQIPISDLPPGSGAAIEAAVAASARMRAFSCAVRHTTPMGMPESTRFPNPARTPSLR